MRPNHLIYRAAASRVRLGWTQDNWYDHAGNPCLVRAICDAAGIKEKEPVLPLQIAKELDVFMMRLPSYCPSSSVRRRHKRMRRKGKAYDLTKCLIGWNDAEGRTKEEVADVLLSLANRLEREQGLSSWKSVDDEIERLWQEHAREHEEQMIAFV